MSSKQAKIDYILKLHKCLEDGSDAALEEVFAQDFKMLVPGTNGRKVEDPPLPDGIEGTYTPIFVADDIRAQGVCRRVAQRI